MNFEEVGSYWGLPLYRKMWLNFIYWFKGFWMFLKVISNYQKSVVENELSFQSAWSLCFAIQEMRMGKTYLYTPLTNKSEDKN